MNFKKLNQIFLIFFSLIISCLVIAYPTDDEPAASDHRGKRHYESHGVTGPVHTFVKTDKHANFKWGVRHHVGQHYAGRR